MSRYAVTVEYWTPKTHDEMRTEDLVVEAIDQESAEDQAVASVHARGGSIEVQSVTATPIVEDATPTTITDEQMFRAVDANAERRRLFAVVEDTPAENDAKIKALCAKLRASLAARGAL